MKARVAEILDGAASAPSGLAGAFTHRELASAVYEVNEPTTAQESAVRRAVAALVADGRAERDHDRRAAAWDHERGWHRRLSRDGEWLLPYRNPAGVLVRRTMTEADRVRREAVVERLFGARTAAPITCGRCHRTAAEVGGITGYGDTYLCRDCILALLANVPEEWRSLLYRLAAGRVA